MSNLSDKISAVRRGYEAECAALEKKYAKLLSEKRGELRDTESRDFYLDYADSYSASLATLEEIYGEIEEIQNRTLGITFRVGSYIKELKARPCDKATDYFARLVAECREAIIMVRTSDTIEGDIEPLKRFCQGLVDLRYLDKNSRALLKADGSPDRDKREAVAAVKAELNSLIEEEREAKRFENMSCYGECVALREEINKNARDMDELRLGDAPRGEEMGHEGGYQFLIGFAEVDLPKADREFAEGFLAADPRGLTASPVYFNYTRNHNTLIVRTDENTLFSTPVLHFVRNFYFSVAGSIYSKGLRFFGVECNPTDSTVVGKVAAKIRNTMGDRYLVLCGDKHSAKDYADMTYGFKELEEIWSKRPDEYDDGDSIFEYNRKNPDNRQEFILSNIWGYPELFNADATGRSYDMLKRLAAGRADEGFITLIGERTDGEFTDRAPRLDAKAMKADVIEVSEDGEFTFNGQPIDVSIERTGFDINRYWSNLKAYNETVASTALVDTMKQLERDRSRGIRVMEPYYRKFIFPMGINEDSSGFDVEVSFDTNQCFGIILGGTRSGKSSFLHSMILSACSYYAPDEIQFYLADFKEGGEEAPEFSNYKLENGGIRNLFMPHIHYLLLQSSPENSVDLLNKIIAMKNERQAFMKPYGSCVQYNASADVREGRRPKLPFIFFLIDEANNMLTGGLSTGATTRDDTKILNDMKMKLENVLKQAASAGIGIFFAGQDTRGFNDGQIGQMGTRICLKVDNEQIFRDIFTIQFRDTMTMISRLEKGKAYYTNEGAKHPPKFVRTAYAGNTTGEAALGVAERVRKKYENEEKFREFYDFQILAGNESFIDCQHARQAEKIALGLEEPKSEDTTAVVYHHPVLMGLSSAAAIPVYLDFNTSTDARGYYAVAPDGKLISAERTAMLSFLESFRNSDGSCPDVSYYALPHIRRASLDGIMERVPELADCITVMRRQSDAARKIMELGKLLEKRIRMLKNDEAGDGRFDPVLMVIHDPEFIYDKKNTDLVDFGEAEAPAPKKEKSASYGDDIYDEDYAEDEEDVMAMFAGFGEPKAEEAPEPKREERKPEISDLRYTANDVRDTMTDLMTNGNRYSIYVLVLATSEKTVDLVKKGMGAEHNFCIYSSLADMRGKTGVRSGAGCVYIIPEGKKTRLIDYTDEDIKRIARQFA